MGKTAGRITAWGFAISVSAGLVFPMSAIAAEPNPTLSGNCDATLQNGKSGNGLVLDAGAPLNSPEALTVGLDSKAKTAEGRNPLVSLPVGDVVKGLGVGEAPVVGGLAANTVCPAAQNVANTVGDTTQDVIKNPPLVPGPIVPPIVQPPTPRPPDPQPEPPKPPVDPAPGNELPVVTDPGSSTGIGGDSIAGVISNAALLPGNFVQAPVITEIIPGQVPPTVDEKDSGNAQAIPAPVTPARLPLLLAVLALAAVAAALVRAWLRRKPA
jgi:hypothetical protein